MTVLFITHARASERRRASSRLSIRHNAGAHDAVLRSHRHAFEATDGFANAFVRGVFVRDGATRLFVRSALRKKRCCEEEANRSVATASRTRKPASRSRTMRGLRHETDRSRTRVRANKTRRVSYLVHLLRDHRGVGFGDGVAPHRLEVKRTRVLVGVPVRRAVHETAPALEPGEPDALVAAVAPVFVRLLRRLRGTALVAGDVARRRRRGRRRRVGARPLRVRGGRRRGGGRRRRRRRRDARFGRGRGHSRGGYRRLLLVHVRALVAHRAHVGRGDVPAERRGDGRNFREAGEPEGDATAAGETRSGAAGARGASRVWLGARGSRGYVAVGVVRKERTRRTRTRWRRAAPGRRSSPRGPSWC